MKHLIEFQNWGLNATTISFVGTIIFSLIQGWGLFKQMETIGRKNSGQSIPLTMNAYLGVHYLAFLFYGLRCDSLAMIVNGFLGVGYLGVYVLAGLHPDSDGWKRWHSVFVVFLPLMAYTAHPQILMGLMLLISCVMLSQFPVEIAFKKDAGAIEPRFIWSFATSASFWTAYSLCIQDWPLLIANVYGIVVMMITWRLWRKYNPQQKRRDMERRLREIEADKSPLFQKEKEEEGEEIRQFLNRSTS